MAKRSCFLRMLLTINTEFKPINFTYTLKVSTIQQLIKNIKEEIKKKSRRLSGEKQNEIKDRYK